MDRDKLKTHIKLCIRNLKSDRVKCCAGCPFEEEITKAYSDLSSMFNKKRSQLFEKSQ